jgi:hypothetical protein
LSVSDEDCCIRDESTADSFLEDFLLDPREEDIEATVDTSFSESEDSSSSSSSREEDSPPRKKPRTARSAASTFGLQDVRRSVQSSMALYGGM